MDTKALKSYYDSDVADSYEASRHSAKWAAEQEAVEQMLSSFPPGATVLDVPVGTGRFLPYYVTRQFRVVGIDSSEDMLERAAHRVEIDPSLVTLRIGDIFHLQMRAGFADVSVCVRFLNLVSTQEMRAVIAELAKVSKRSVILGVRHVVPLSELRLWHPTGLLSLLGRLVSLVRRRIEGKIVVHQLHDVLAAVAGARLVVSKSVCVEHRRDGTDYCIYLLTPDDP